MWIRSQDKMGLFKAIGFKIREHGFEDGTKEFIILSNDNLYNVLGTYKSKERAIEVLDEIEAFIENNYISIDEMPSHNNSPYPNYCPIHFTTTTRKKVFKMPEE